MQNAKNLQMSIVECDVISDYFQCVVMSQSLS